MRTNQLMQGAVVALLAIIAVLLGVLLLRPQPVAPVQPSSVQAQAPPANTPTYVPGGAPLGTASLYPGPGASTPPPPLGYNSTASRPTVSSSPPSNRGSGRVVDPGTAPATRSASRTGVAPATRSDNLRDEFDAYIRWVANVEKERERIAAAVPDAQLQYGSPMIRAASIEDVAKRRPFIALAVRAAQAWQRILADSRAAANRAKPHVPTALAVFDSQYAELLQAEYEFAESVVDKTRRPATKPEAPFRSASMELTRAFAGRGIPQPIRVNADTISAVVQPY